MKTLKHIISITGDSYKEYRAAVWCQEQFGQEYWAGNKEGIWQVRMDYNNNYSRIFSFEYQRDAVIFALRWS